MRAFLIDNQKVLMQHLLVRETFDGLLLSEAVVKKGATLTLDGHGEEGLFAYGTFRELLYAFIKGKETPSFLKVVLLSPEEVPGLSSRAVNILFRDGALQVTTGVAYENFSLDRTPEMEWDAAVEGLLRKNDIDFSL